MICKTIILEEDRPEVTLSAYITGETGELSFVGKRPAILICPGGAYLSCSDREAEPVALRFVSMGYQAFVLRYSVYGEEEPFPDLSKPMQVREECQYPVPLLDIGRAMLTIREHSGEWYVDPERIVLCGFSAGAHNAALYSVYWNTRMVSGAFRAAPEALRPAAAILGYTLSDLSYLKACRQGPMETGLFERMLTAYLGGSNPKRERLEEVSPCLHVTEDTPPAFLWATCGDRLVPVQHSLRMAQALAEHGIPFELHVFEEGDHGLGLATQATALAKSQIDPDASKWVELAERWLQKRFALNLPEKAPFEAGLEQGNRL